MFIVFVLFLAYNFKNVAVDVKYNLHPSSNLPRDVPDCYCSRIKNLFYPRFCRSRTHCHWRWSHEREEIHEILLFMHHLKQSLLDLLLDGIVLVEVLVTDVILMRLIFKTKYEQV